MKNCVQTLFDVEPSFRSSRKWGWKILVELIGIEPMASSLRTTRSPS